MWTLATTIMRTTNAFLFAGEGSLLQTKVGRWAVLRLLRTRSFRSTRWTTAEVRSCCVRRALHIPSPPINSKCEVNSARRLSARQSQLSTLSPHWTTARKGVAPVPMLPAGILAGVLGLALGAHGAPGTAAVQPNTFQEVRVCAYEAFSLRQQRCTRDQRTQLLVSSRFGCSVIFDVRQRATFREQMVYEGQKVTGLMRTLPPGSYGYWMAASTYSTLPNPGGRWRCLFSLGAVRTSVSFRSGGPTGAIVDTAICRFYAALVRRDGFPDCQTDESLMPIPPTKGVICQALYPLDAGKTAEIDVHTTNEPGFGRSHSLIVRGPLWKAYAVLRASDAGPGSSLPPGDYVCRFKLDGALVGEKAFQITG